MACPLGKRRRFFCARNASKHSRLDVVKLGLFNGRSRENSAPGQPSGGDGPYMASTLANDRDCERIVFSVLPKNRRLAASVSATKAPTQDVNTNAAPHTTPRKQTGSVAIRPHRGFTRGLAGGSRTQRGHSGEWPRICAQTFVPLGPAVWSTIFRVRPLRSSTRFKRGSWLGRVVVLLERRLSDRWARPTSERR